MHFMLKPNHTIIVDNASDWTTRIVNKTSRVDFVICVNPPSQFCCLSLRL